MMPNNTPPKHSPSRRELREERARAFWQAQINEGRAQRAEEQSRTKKPAAIPEAPEPAEAPQAAPPPAPLPEISAEPAADVMQAVDAAHLAGMASSAIPAVNRILDVIDAGTADGRRFSATPRRPKIGRLGASCSATFPALTDQRGSDGDRHVAAKWRCRNPFLSRPSQSSRQPGVVRQSSQIPTALSCG